MARRGRHLAVADLPLADARLRLRRRRLLATWTRCSGSLADCGPPDRRGTRPRDAASCSTSCPTTRPRTMRGSSTPGRRGRARIATGTCGGTRRPTAGRRTNWQSQFGGPAWTLDDATGQYWYHSFLPEQPELDWRNPAVRDALLDAMRFWFARGIDGFRVDVLWMIAKDEWPWRDDPVDPGPGAVGPGPRRRPRPRRRPGHGGAPPRAARRRRRVPERVLVGEVYMEPRRLVRYYGSEGRARTCRSTSPS